MITPTTKLPLRDRNIFSSSAIFALTQQAPTIELERGLVLFVFERTDQVNAALDVYLQNGLVPIQDFEAAYKTLRSKMYSARG